MNEIAIFLFYSETSNVPKILRYLIFVINSYIYYEYYQITPFLEKDYLHLQPFFKPGNANVNVISET